MGTSDWADYWDGAVDRRLFAVEAADYVRRLRQAVPVRPTDRVLDFGCGFGHVAVLLAARVAAISLWDPARGIRTAARARTAALANVDVVDLVDGVPSSARGTFDLILVNSAVQYMVPTELAAWMACWPTLLRPGGRIVLSDVPRPGTSLATEVLGMLRFAVRHGVLARVLWDGLEEIRRYAGSRRRVDLQRWEPAALADLAGRAGLATEHLARNLTHAPGRFSVLLTRAADSLR